MFAENNLENHVMKVILYKKGITEKASCIESLKETYLSVSLLTN